MFGFEKTEEYAMQLDNLFWIILGLIAIIIIFYSLKDWVNNPEEKQAPPEPEVQEPEKKEENDDEVKEEQVQDTNNSEDNQTKEEEVSE